MRPGRVLMTGAGEHVERLPDPEPARRARPARPTPSSRRPTSTARPTASASRAPASSRAGARRPRGTRLHNDLQDAARSLCPAIDAALDTARAAGADHALVSGSGPTVVGLFLGADGPAPRAEGARRMAARVRRRARRRRVGSGDAADAPLPARGRRRPRDLPRRPPPQLGRATLAVGAIVVAALALWGLGVVEPPNLTKLIEDVGTRLGKWTYLLVGALAFLETGAFVGLVAPGESAILIGGVVAGQGQISIVRPDRHRLGLRRRRRPDLLHARPPARPRLPRAPRAAAEDHRGAAAVRRGLLRPPRRLTILIGRFIGLVRAIAPFIAGASKMELRRSSPTTSSARACGRRCSACSATSSGSRWTRSRRTSARAPRRSRGLVVVVPRDLVRRRLRPRRGVPRQGPASGSSAARRGSACAARSTFDRRPRHVRARARHAAGARRRRHLPVLLARVADRHAAARSGSTRTRSTIADALYMPALGTIVRVAHRPRLAARSPPLAVLAHRGLGRRGTAATREGAALVVAHALTYVAVHIAKDATDRPRPSDPHAPPRGSPIPRATPPTRSRYVACAIVLARGGHRLGDPRRARRPSRSRSPPRSPPAASTCARTTSPT